SGYSLFIRDGKLVHDMNIGGQHHVVESDRPLPRGHCRLGIRVQAGPLVPVPPPPAPMHAMVPAWREGTLLIDGQPAGSLRTQAGFNNFISWSGVDIGRNRASAVSTRYEAPFAFSGKLKHVTVTLDAPQGLDGEAVGRAEMSRQ
ncbi:MAG: arylsulfatase, partial [Burkholderiaceae bacterium]|nr:arylsulfatase [Burkholderiaceae bacterium]